MAELGFRNFDDLIGRTDCLDVRRAVEHWKAQGLDLEPILLRRPPRPQALRFRRVDEQDHELEGRAGLPPDLALPPMRSRIAHRS